MTEKQSPAERQASPSATAKPTVPEVLPLVVAYYAKEGNSVGGSLHVVLEDGNVEDSSIEFCRTYALERGDDDGVRLADVLFRMSRTQRLKLYGADKQVAW